MKKLLLIPFVLFTFILGNYFISNNVEAMSVNPNCTYDSNSQPVCPQWDPVPGYCDGGTLIDGGTNECGCSQPPSCEMPSPVPTTDPSPTPTGTPAPSPYPSPPLGCHYQIVQCIQAPCDPVLICPSPSPAPSPVIHQNCQNDSDCSNNEFCYQPPMPYCPPGAFCAQVMPAKYCKERDILSIVISDNLPEQLTYLTLVVDNNPKVFNLDSKNPKVTSDGGGDLDRRVGYAMGFKFNVKKGQNVDLLAKELDINTVGSYVGTHLYGPDKKRISYSLGSTRSNVKNAPEDGTYYWIVQTFSNKEGKIQVQAYDYDKSKIKAWFITAEGNTLLNPNNGTKYLGRYEFKLQMEYPSPVTLNNDGTLEYFNHSAGKIVKEQPKLLISKDPITFALGALSKATLIKINKLSNTKIEITPDSTIKNVFDPGYYYALVSQSIFDSSSGIGGTYTSYFRASSSSVYLTADLNNDQKVNILDYTLLSSQFMETEYVFADINLDGRVNLMDFTIMMAQFNPNFALP